MLFHIVQQHCYHCLRSCHQHYHHCSLHCGCQPNQKSAFMDEVMIIVLCSCSSSALVTVPVSTIFTNMSHKMVADALIKATSIYDFKGCHSSHVRQDSSSGTFSATVASVHLPRRLQKLHEPYLGVPNSLFAVLHLSPSLYETSTWVMCQPSKHSQPCFVRATAHVWAGLPS